MPERPSPSDQQPQQDLSSHFTLTEKGDFIFNPNVDQGDLIEEGLTEHDIIHQLQSMQGMGLSPELVAKVTAAIKDSENKLHGLRMALAAENISLDDYIRERNELRELLHESGYPNIALNE